MRVNGLYGHVRENDVRSLVLFAGFVAAVHLLAMLSLALPLALYDPRHAPLYDWGGYLTRWVPVVTLAGAVLFAVQLAWHVRFVRRRTAFRFVDNTDEPRLCRIVEPLAIAAGLPSPYVAVIETPALNAFACGVRRRDAVLVFTRGLIEGLDDEELAAVAAHELAHIVNGDIRLIAAANVCLDSLLLLQRRRKLTLTNRIGQAVMLPVLALAVPLLFVLVMAALVLQRLAVEAGRLTRLLIASSREFIADAEAVRLTQNPAALVSALRRIDGRSRLAGLAAGQDAMMIDGETAGPLATHPAIAARVAAIISVTGSMALIAPVRRDTRERSGEAEAPAFGRRAAQAPPAAAAPAPRRERLNLLGLTPEMSVGALAAVAAFASVHAGDLRHPAALAAAFDPRPLTALVAAARLGANCQTQGLAALAGQAAMPKACGEGAITATFASHSAAAVAPRPAAPPPPPSEPPPQP